MGFHNAEIVIAGGGPIGLAAAIALRQAGADVLIADALEPPVDKACGEGLMPDSLSELAKLGIDLTREDGAPLLGIRFTDSHSTATADFTGTDGLGVRRLALHRVLLDRAAALGVRMMWRTSVRLRAGQSPTLGDEGVRYRYLIGADGESSRTRRWAGLQAGVLRSRRFGFRAHFELDEVAALPAGNYVEVYWGATGQAYVTPVGERTVCVSVISRSQQPGTFQRTIDSIPALRQSLSRSRQLTPQRGAVTTTSSFDRVVRGNVALIGDASGSVDAITGEGLAVGFRQALLLRDSIGEGSLDRYQAQHADILRLPQRMARAMLLMDRHANLRRHALRTFASRPDLFRAMLRVHLNEERFSSIALRHGIEFGKVLLCVAD
ncbi:MAG: NAD(P)/FAD-dependent oxidoreductase [Acidobacteriota bacterium]|nr:NAD(P)/FAD-dependent oxidoreductase [Acidobacteriota bacterium]